LVSGTDPSAFRKFGSGISPISFSATGSMRSGGMMFPGNGVRLAPVLLPVAGS
jgi:hypothetical protein